MLMLHKCLLNLRKCLLDSADFSEDIEDNV